MLRKALLFLFYLSLTGIFGCGMFATYSAGAIELHLVEPMVGLNHPVQGAVVVAVWKQKGGMEGGNIIGHLMVQEAVSDKNGRVFFPAWGPKSGAAPDSGSPTFIIFKSGYYHTVRSNGFRPPREYVLLEDGRLTSVWNGKKVPMLKFEKGNKEYRREVVNCSDKLGYVIENCGWKYIPQMMAELTKYCSKNNCRLSDYVDIRKWAEAYKENTNWYKSIETRCKTSPVNFFKEYYYE